MKNVLLKASLTLAVIAFASSIGLISGAGIAQAAGMSKYSPAPSHASKIDNATLHKAARAYVKISKINAQTGQKLKRASSRSAKQQVLADARSKEKSAVRGQGISVSQYNHVIRSVQTDASLRSKFSSYVSSASSH